jgi:hypothetical protein
MAEIAPTSADPGREAVLRFERAFRAGADPNLDDFLEGEGPPRWRLLIELLHSDLELRWRAGRPTRLEAYLRRYPELACFPNEQLALLEAEVRLRRRAGERPTPAEYLQAYPALAEDIPQVFRRLGKTWPEVAGYLILGEIGRGGMGVVYRARQVLLNREVALKVIRWETVADESRADQLRARLRQEAEAVAAVKHPNVIQIYQTAQTDGELVLAMELLEGGSLQQRLHSARVLEPRAAAVFLEKVARGVQAVHERGIVHRDLKPDNILLDGEGEPRVADFGLARPLEAAGQTRPGAIVGTPEYMAPEQAGQDGAAVTPATDVYGLGAILYAVLTGRPPFPREDLLTTLAKVRSQAVVPVRALRPSIPRDLETICLRCLAKAPAERYPSARELADDLRRFGAGEPIRARPAGVMEKLWKGVRRRPDRALALAALGLFVLGGVVGLALFAAYQTGVNAQLRQLNSDLEQLNADLADRTGQARRGSVALFALAETDLAKNPAKAEGFLKLGIQILEPLTGVPPHDRESRDARALLATAYYRLGQIERDRRKLAEARGHWLQSAAVSEALVRDAPDEPRYRADLPRTYFNLAMLAQDRKQADEHEAMLNRVIGILRPGTRVGSKEAWFLSYAHGYRSYVNRLRHAWAEALADLTEALRYSDGRSNREEFLGQIGQELIEQLPAEAALRVGAARVYAVAAVAALGDSKQTQAKREAEATN